MLIAFIFVNGIMGLWKKNLPQRHREHGGAQRLFSKSLRETLYTECLSGEFKKYKWLKTLHGGIENTQVHRGCLRNPSVKLCELGVSVVNLKNASAEVNFTTEA
jgi:hypothetical protein